MQLYLLDKYYNNNVADGMIIQPLDKEISRFTALFRDQAPFMVSNYRFNDDSLLDRV